MLSAFSSFGVRPPKVSGVPNRWQLLGVTWLNRIKVDLPTLFFQFVHSWHKQSSFRYVVVANIRNFLSNCSLGGHILRQINTSMQFYAFLFTKYSRLSAAHIYRIVAQITSKTPYRQSLPFLPDTWGRYAYSIPWCGRCHSWGTSVPPHSDRMVPHRRWCRPPQYSGWTYNQGTTQPWSPDGRAHALRTPRPHSHKPCSDISVSKPSYFVEKHGLPILTTRAQERNN